MAGFEEGGDVGTEQGRQRQEYAGALPIRTVRDTLAIPLKFPQVLGVCKTMMM